MNRRTFIAELGAAAWPVVARAQQTVRVPRIGVLMAFAESDPEICHMPLPKAPSSGFVPPCIPTRAAKPPAGPDWIHEIKHDGYRLQVRRDGDTVRLFTRRGYDWSGRYPAIAESYPPASRLINFAGQLPTPLSRSGPWQIPDGLGDRVRS
jgi:ATP-dependent DNA ligase